jgi:hypothetical protein
VTVSVDMPFYTSWAFFVPPAVANDENTAASSGPDGIPIVRGISSKHASPKSLEALGEPVVSPGRAACSIGLRLRCVA